MLSRAGLHRRNFINQNISGVLNVLEIGAFDNATFRRDMGDDVKYIDYFSSAELYDTYKDNPRRNMARLVDVDFVVKDTNFSDRVSGPYSLVVGNHVVEHVPNIVGWLNQIESILTEGGKVFLAVPDKRYTFDIHRPLTTWIDAVRAHTEARTMPDALTIAANHWYFTKVDAAALWGGEPAPPLRHKNSLRQILQTSAEAAESTSTHIAGYSRQTHLWS